MNMFKPTAAKSVETYIAGIDEPRRSDIIALDKLIRKTAPGLKQHWATNMIGYGSFHFKYANGKEGDWPIIALASQKNYISLYVCATDDQGYIAERFRSQLPKASIGRSCIRFKRLSDIDLDVLANVIRLGANAPNNF